VKNDEREGRDLFDEGPHERDAGEKSHERVARKESHAHAAGRTSRRKAGADSAAEQESEMSPTQEPATAADQPVSFKSEETVGEILFAARERLGQTLEFMSQETKIPKPMLQYLETDNYEALPAKVYAKSFLRTYAITLGLDAQHILSKYEVQTGQTHRSKGDRWEIESEIVEEKIRSPLVLKRIIIPAVIGISLLIIIVKFAGKREEKAEPQRQLSLKEELLQRKPEQKPAESQQIEPVEVQSGVEPMELRVASNPTDSCWFELVTVSVVEQQPETTVSKFTLPPGRSRAFQATEEFFFKKVGNAGGFVMELNGNKLPTLGKKGKVITNYKITRENLPKDKKND
jgi:cytoskeleton protein RodZ